MKFFKYFPAFCDRDFCGLVANLSHATLTLIVWHFHPSSLVGIKFDGKLIKWYDRREYLGFSGKP